MISLNMIRLPSSLSGQQLHVLVWQPEQPTAVVQLVHGMAEHIARYDDFARFLCSKGYAVIGHSHLGHGLTAESADDFGYFGKKNGWQRLCDDTHIVACEAEKLFPGLPRFIFGHSMGSFVVRTYITQPRSKELAGVVLSGTGQTPAAVLRLGKVIIGTLKAFRGGRHRSGFVNSLSFGGYGKAFAPCRTDFGWLTTDEAKVDQYIADPMCGFCFTLNGFSHLFDGLLYIGKKKNIAKARTDLPCLFLSGDRDPVGDNGKGVLTLADRFRSCGMTRVEAKLYPDCRHEVINEAGRQDKYADIYGFFSGCIKG